MNFQKKKDIFNSLYVNVYRMYTMMYRLFSSEIYVINECHTDKNNNQQKAIKIKFKSLDAARLYVTVNCIAFKIYWVVWPGPFKKKNNEYYTTPKPNTHWSEIYEWPCILSLPLPLWLIFLTGPGGYRQ